MSTITDTVSRVVRRIALGIGGLLPSPPPTELPPPDIDGRRDAGNEDEAVLEARFKAKDGHGGVR